LHFNGLNIHVYNRCLFFVVVNWNATLFDHQAIWWFDEYVIWKRQAAKKKQKQIVTVCVYYAIMGWYCYTKVIVIVWSIANIFIFKPKQNFGGVMCGVFVLKWNELIALSSIL
jgi:hypothetical protein